ncbi:uncharacterized protein ASCRUDRAFT_127184 [Ascoidea rubescens DSM 1968]|uniref:FAR1 domain-containing protein n=1 Tax=Ascoidea rubescens DSM 1968 TaxID=1344418 RepID=A0A1D2VND4_9ASCO|nr:hypothetical protein ASCRUDRAFT_127184 [Ascoidea rubescens DSM 1968]ODV63106.1 hypothetical protein ASCRUDRAFT_127184 [Ascoidea rubescens DSM 1968]
MENKLILYPFSKRFSSYLQARDYVKFDYSYLNNCIFIEKSHNQSFTIKYFSCSYSVKKNHNCNVQIKIFLNQKNGYYYLITINNKNVHNHPLNQNDLKVILLNYNYHNNININNHYNYNNHINITNNNNNNDNDNGNNDDNNNNNNSDINQINDLQFFLDQNYISFLLSSFLNLNPISILNDINNTNQDNNNNNNNNNNNDKISLSHIISFIDHFKSNNYHNLPLLKQLCFKYFYNLSYFEEKTILIQQNLLNNININNINNAINNSIIIHNNSLNNLNSSTHSRNSSTTSLPHTYSLESPNLSNSNPINPIESSFPLRNIDLNTNNSLFASNSNQNQFSNVNTFSNNSQNNLNNTFNNYDFSHL